MTSLLANLVLLFKLLEIIYSVNFSRDFRFTRLHACTSSNKKKWCKKKINSFSFLFPDNSFQISIQRTQNQYGKLAGLKLASFDA